MLETVSICVALLVVVILAAIVARWGRRKHLERKSQAQARAASAFVALQAARASPDRQTSNLDATRQAVRRADLAAARTLASRIEMHLARLEERVRSAEAALRKAQNEFAARALSPFWEAVESTATALNEIDAKVQDTVKLAQQQATLCRKYPDQVHPLPVLTRRLPNAQSVAEALQALVRQAQCDYNFASIYEQRKTNQILVAGFGSLAAAIDALSISLVSSLNRLEAATRSGFTDVSQRLQASTEEATSGFAALERATREHADAARAAEARRAEHERKMRETQRAQTGMLDNIQRKRKPLV